MAEPVMCPACGWTGSTADLERDGDVSQCPVCAKTVEVVE